MSKKILLPVFMLLFFISAFAQQPPAPAENIMKEAFQSAKRQNKKVLVMFHASWCGWCHKMDASLNDESCKKFFDDNFIIRHVVVMESKGKENLENPGGKEMMEKYDGIDTGIPYWLIFDNAGNLVADSRMPADAGKPGSKPQNTGCPASKPEVEYFIEVLKKTTSLREKELDIIRIRFRKNEVVATG